MIKHTLVMAVLTLSPLVAVAPAVSAELPSPVGPFDYTGRFISPLDPGAFGEFAERTLILSPYGSGGKFECTAFHGQTMACTQSGPDGASHTLIRLSPTTPPSAFRETWALSPFAS